jgi:hypothetical protein
MQISTVGHLDLSTKMIKKDHTTDQTNLKTDLQRNSVEKGVQSKKQSSRTFLPYTNQPLIQCSFHKQFRENEIVNK